MREHWHNYQILDEDAIKREKLRMMIADLEAKLSHCGSRKSARAIKRKLERFRTALLTNVLSRDD